MFTIAGQHEKNKLASRSTGTTGTKVTETKAVSTPSDGWTTNGESKHAAYMSVSYYLNPLGMVIDHRKTTIDRKQRRRRVTALINEQPLSKSSKYFG